jgi:hypothetical protein
MRSLKLGKIGGKTTCKKGGKKIKMSKFYNIFSKVMV